jgi:hypothetical protein
VNRRLITDASGKAVEQLAITVRDMRAPERRYSAESAFVHFNGTDAVYFIFVQEKLDGSARSMLSVKTYCDAARQFHETLGPLRPYMEKYLALGAKVSVMPKAEPEQTLAVAANLIQAAFTGFEAEMRFYYVSPYALHTSNQNSSSQVAIDPVVQVDFPMTMLVALIKHLDQIVVTLPRTE